MLPPPWYESFSATTIQWRINMKVLVTGGAGFIGSNLTALLMREGHEVTVLDSLVSGYRENLKPLPHITFINGDVRDISILRIAARDAEVIFHLAASVGNTRSIEHPIIDAEVNVLGTLNVLEAAREFGTRKVVFSSSAGIYRWGAMPLPIPIGS